MSDALDAVDRLLDKVPPKPPTPVTIPGNLIAYWQDGKIVKWIFVPAAGDAGYFGEAAIEMDADAHLLRANEDARTLEVEETDGPFWRAVQQSLIEANPFPVEWEE